jgi:hypothetical protein
VISFRLVTGRRVDLADPGIDDVDVAAIACGLSKICRFTGQLRSFYSVAQHAMMVAELVEPHLRFAALHHDDSEAYLNDLSRNLKHSDYLAGYRRLEERWSFVLETALGIQLTDWERHHIKAADDLLAIFERVVLRNGHSWEAPFHVDQSLSDGFIGNAGRREEILRLSRRIPEEWHDYYFQTLAPEAAEHKFLERHHIYRKQGVDRG